MCLTDMKEAQLRNTDKCTNYYGNNSFNYDGCEKNEAKTAKAT